MVHEGSSSCVIYDDRGERMQLHGSEKWVRRTAALNGFLICQVANIPDRSLHTEVKMYLETLKHIILILFQDSFHSEFSTYFSAKTYILASIWIQFPLVPAKKTKFLKCSVTFKTFHSIFLPWRFSYSAVKKHWQIKDKNLRRNGNIETWVVSSGPRGKNEWIVIVRLKM